jgi:hypothetical protein
VGDGSEADSPRGDREEDAPSVFAGLDHRDGVLSSFRRAS